MGSRCNACFGTLTVSLVLDVVRNKTHVPVPLKLHKPLAELRSAAGTLTRFELDPHTGVVLDLLDHLSVSADDYAHGKPRHCHLPNAQTSAQHA